jgi:hypothetical protein
MSKDDAAAKWLREHEAAKRIAAAVRQQARERGRALKWTRKHPRGAWPAWVKAALKDGGQSITTTSP